VPGKSPVNVAGGADAKGKGKKRKAEAGDKQAKGAGAVGDDEGTPAKKKKKPAQPKKTAGDKKNEGEGTAKSPGKGGSDANQDKDRTGGQDGDDDKEGKEDGEDDEEELDDADDDLANDKKYMEMQEARQKLFQDQLQTKEDWLRYQDMRRSKFDDKETKALISKAADVPDSFFKTDAGAKIVFTLKGMAKVLVGQLVDHARQIRQEWGEDQDSGKRGLGTEERWGSVRKRGEE